MGENTTQNMSNSFPEINKLCKVASHWKYIKTNTLTMHGPLNIKKSWDYYYLLSGEEWWDRSAGYGEIFPYLFF